MSTRRKVQKWAKQFQRLIKDGERLPNKAQDLYVGEPYGY